MGRRFALLIGNSRYEDAGLARLAAPDADVMALAAVLRDSAVGGFDEVQPLVDERFGITRRAIAWFFEERRRDDLLLLYFSGHGIRDAYGLLHLAVRDTERELLAGTAIESSFITNCMDRCASKRLVLVLDCCHSGAFGYGAKAAAGASVGTAVAFEGNGRGRIVLTATDSTQFAWEGDTPVGASQPSLFTRHLIHGLRSGAADVDCDGLITVDELYEYVYDQVLNETSKQTPGKWAFGQQGEIVLARSPGIGAPGVAILDEAPARPARSTHEDEPRRTPPLRLARDFMARHRVATALGAALAVGILWSMWTVERQAERETTAVQSAAIPLPLEPREEPVAPAVADEPSSAASRGGNDVAPPGETESRDQAARRSETPAATSAPEPQRQPTAQPSREPGRVEAAPTRSPAIVRAEGESPTSPSVTPPAVQRSDPPATMPRATEPRRVEPDVGTAAAGPAPSTRAPAAAAAAPPPAPTAPTAAALIEQALTEYKEAAEALDLDQLREVWPDAPDSLQRSYRSMRSQSVNISRCAAPAIDGDRATIVCQERVSVVAMGGISPPSVTSTTTFVLRRNAGRWEIDDINRQLRR